MSYKDASKGCLFWIGFLAVQLIAYLICRHYFGDHAPLAMLFLIAAILALSKIFQK